MWHKFSERLDEQDKWWDKNIAWNVPRISTQRLLLAQIAFGLFSTVFISLIFYTMQVGTMNIGLAIALIISWWLSIHFGSIWFRHVNKTGVEDKLDDISKAITDLTNEIRQERNERNSKPKQ